MKIIGYDPGRKCDGCGSKMPPFFPRRRSGDSLVCTTCFEKEAVKKAILEVTGADWYAMQDGSQLIEYNPGYAKVWVGSGGSGGSGSSSSNSIWHWEVASQRGTPIGGGATDSEDEAKEQALEAARQRGLFASRKTATEWEEVALAIAAADAKGGLEPFWRRANRLAHEYADANGMTYQEVLGKYSAEKSKWRAMFDEGGARISHKIAGWLRSGDPTVDAIIDKIKRLEDSSEGERQRQDMRNRRTVNRGTPQMQNMEWERMMRNTDYYDTERKALVESLPQWYWDMVEEAEFDAWESSRKIAHDSPGTDVIFHCPFCGAGQVTGRSDGTAECSFCNAVFTVQTQPRMNTVPQTIEGQPYLYPDLNDPGSYDSDTDPVLDSEPTPLAPEEQSSGPLMQGDPFENFSQTAKFRVGTAILSADDFMAHLAVKYADDRMAALRAVRSSRRA